MFVTQDTHMLHACHTPCAQLWGQPAKLFQGHSVFFCSPHSKRETEYSIQNKSEQYKCIHSIFVIVKMYWISSVWCIVVFRLNHTIQFSSWKSTLVSVFLFCFHLLFHVNINVCNCQKHTEREQNKKNEFFLFSYTYECHLIPNYVQLFKPSLRLFRSKKNQLNANSYQFYFSQFQLLFFTIKNQFWARAKKSDYSWISAHTHLIIRNFRCERPLYKQRLLKRGGSTQGNSQKHFVLINNRWDIIWISAICIRFPFIEMYNHPFKCASGKFCKHTTNMV